MRASYFDVDDEKIFDLLSCRVIPSPSGPDAATLPYGRAFTTAIGLSEIECNTIDDVLRCLEKGLSFDRGIPVPSLDHHSIFQVHAYESM